MQKLEVLLKWKKKLKLYKKCEGEGQRRINYWNNAMIFILGIFVYFVIQYSGFLGWEKNKISSEKAYDVHFLILTISKN